jgi:radical SAM superfamily enzyme YgiQ (UPF0313 family)
MIKNARREIKIILGGPEAGYNASHLLTAYPFVDGIIAGEGEEATKALADNVPFSQIPNLIWKKDGVVTANPFSYMDLSKIPFPYREEDLAALQNKIVYFETSRGCLYRCSYCLSSSQGKTRVFPMDYVKKGLSFFMDHRIPLVKLVDRTFNENQERACEIVEYILQHNQNTHFHFEISPQLLTDPFLHLCGRCGGKIQFEMGIQTTNPDTMGAIRRIYSPEKTAEKIRRIPPNIHTHIDLIAGLPYETLSSFREGFNYVYHLRPSMLQLGFLKLLHHTPLKAEAGKYKIITTSFPPYEVLSTADMSPEEIILLKKMEKAVDRIYNSGIFSRTLEALEQEDMFEVFLRIGQRLAQLEQKGPISREGLYTMLYNLYGESLLKPLAEDFLTHHKKAPLPESLAGSPPSNLKQLHKALIKLPPYQHQKVRLAAARQYYFAVTDGQVTDVSDLLTPFLPEMDSGN